MFCVYPRSRYHMSVYRTIGPLFTFVIAYLSLVMRKPKFCICKNKDADQLRGNREADQRLCFRYIHVDSTIPLLSKSEISSLSPSYVAVQPGLCWTWSETRTLVFSRRGSWVYYIFYFCSKYRL